ncbi:hypothetical protein ACNKHP_18590 [Shigella boydii]
MTAEQRKIAPGLYKDLSSIATNCRLGNGISMKSLPLRGGANEKGFRADDIQIRDADTLLEVSETSKRQ